MAGEQARICSELWTYYATIKRMTTTIQVDPQTAQVLADQAASQGLSVQEYLKKHFSTALAGQAIDDVDQWLDELVEGLPQLPPLPGDFSTRDIYADHD